LEAPLKAQNSTFLLHCKKKQVSSPRQANTHQANTHQANTYEKLCTVCIVLVTLSFQQQNINSKTNKSGIGHKIFAFHNGNPLLQ
jgi:hypothetical protein